MNLKRNQIHIGVCLNETIDVNQFEEYVSQVPSDIQLRIEQKVRDSDKQALLFGRLLLRSLALELMGEFNWNNIEYGEFGRPHYSEGDLNFNISHSGKYVVCSVQKEGLIGIDIEKVNKISVNDFKSAFCHEELNYLSSSNNPDLGFYTLWTKKEAFVKALGVGIGHPLHELNALESKFEDSAQLVYSGHIDISPDYVCSYVSSFEFSEIIMREFQF